MVKKDQHIVRRKNGKNFTYYYNNGRKVNDKNTLEHINKIRIPPAYHNVMINGNKNAKLLAIGLDDAERKQYLYNPKWVEKQSKKKYEKMAKFGEKLPKIKRDIAKYLNSKKMSKEKIIALVLRIILLCNFRIGNESCKNAYNSFGISTINRSKVKIDSNKVTFDFIGKKGVRNVCSMRDPTSIKIIKTLYKQSHSKNHFFSVKIEDNIYKITSHDINNFLKKYGDFTAKDFRTWVANVEFIKDLLKHQMSDKITHRKKATRESIKNTAEKLHHTPAICKKSYIHNAVIDLYIEKPKKFNSVFKGDPEKGFISFVKH
jgi:DNA topoisomerase I